MGGDDPQVGARPLRRRRRRTVAGRPHRSPSSRPRRRSSRPTSTSRSASGMAGDVGPQVQERLDELGFFVGPDRRPVRQPHEHGDVGVREARDAECPATRPTGIVTDEMWQHMQQPDPRRAAALALRGPDDEQPHRDLPARAGRRVLRRRRSGADQPHLERRRAGVARGRHDRPRRVRQRERHRADRAPRDRRVGHAGRLFRFDRMVEGSAQQRPRRDVGPRLLQLRHRHPRRPQRAAAPGVARLHPGAADGRRDRSTTTSTSATSVFVWDGDQGARGLRRTPAPPTRGARCRSSTGSTRRTRRRPRRRPPPTTVAPTTATAPAQPTRRPTWRQTQPPPTHAGDRRPPPPTTTAPRRRPPSATVPGR